MFGYKPYLVRVIDNFHILGEQKKYVLKAVSSWVNWMIRAATMTFHGWPYTVIFRD